MVLIKRQKVLVNRRVQFSMMLHTAGHWVLFLLGTLLLLLGLQVLFGEPSGSYSEHVGRMWDRYGPAVVVLLVLMPVVIYDTLKLGHRIAGPMFRLSGALHRLARGENVQRVSFRKEDFWHEMAADFNLLVERLKREQAGDPSADADELEVAERVTV